MTRRKHYHRISEEDFTKIKALTDAKLSISIISKVTGRSWGVIAMIGKSENFNEYQGNVRATIFKYSKKAVHEDPDNPEGMTYPQIGGLLVELNNNMVKVVKILQNWKGGEN